MKKIQQKMTKKLNKNFVDVEILVLLLQYLRQWAL